MRALIVTSFVLIAVSLTEIGFSPMREPHETVAAQIRRLCASPAGSSVHGQMDCYERRSRRKALEMLSGDFSAPH
jgi:hypothetical protein